MNTSIRRLFKGGSIVFIGLVVDMGISFVAKAAILRYLGPIDYGAVSIGLVFVYTIQRIGMIGMDKGVTRYLPRYDADADRRGVVVTGFVVGLGLALVLSAAVFLVAPFLAAEVFSDPDLGVVIQLFAVIAPFAVLLRFAVATARGMSMTAPRVVLQNITEPLSRMVLIGVAIVLGAGVIGGSLAYGLPYVLGGVMGVYFLWRWTPLMGDARPKMRYREMIFFSAPLAVTGSMWFVFSDIDTYLLAALTSTGEVGIYRGVYPLATLLTITLSAFSFLAMPILSEHHSNEEYDEMRHLYTTLSKWIFLGGLPILFALVLVPREVIFVTFGDQYIEGATALRVLALGFGTHILVGPNTNALTSIGRSKLVMVNSIIGAVSNVALNLVLIPEYGIVGAAVATTGSYVLVNALMSLQLYYLVRIQPFSGSMVVVGALSLAAFVGSTRALDLVVPVRGILWSLALATLFGVVYAVILLFTAVGDDEEIILVNVERRFDVDLSTVRWLADLGP